MSSQHDIQAADRSAAIRKSMGRKRRLRCSWARHPISERIMQHGSGADSDDLVQCPFAYLTLGEARMMM
ncbi:hypothetical protein [Paracoccus beibuensis]|uniref:hypothetical protein n=1 Tax=Paracoccus beibuensis TaxID=547602 RepID=UPI002240188D|nr:hypothetical protein [Paracoccus beibuensis]